MRIAGVTLPDNKQLAYSLPIIVGIGPSRALDILKKANVAPNKKGSELTPDEEQTIRTLAEGYTIEGGRTKTNSRTVRGNTRKTMGSGRRSLEKT